MCPSPRSLAMSCVSAYGTWYPFKSNASSTSQTNEDAFHLLFSTSLIELEDEKQEQQQKEHLRLLKTLSRHLDILTAGSLFLLPSILPFLASAIIASTSTSTSTPNSSDRFFAASPNAATSGGVVKDELGCFWIQWNTLWILMLPCVGVLIPLSTFKIMSLLEESGFQCPYKRWRQKHQSAARPATVACEQNEDEHDDNKNLRKEARTATSATAGWRGFCRLPGRNSNVSMISSSCPTILAIQSTWRYWRGHPHGYGPLSLDTSTPSSPSLASSSSPTSSPCQTCCSPKECSHWSQFSAPPTLPLTSASPALSSSGMQEIDLGVQSLSSSHNQCLGHCHKVINNHNITHQQQQTVEEVRVKVVRSVLPRPRSILLGSLFAWTVLMALSSPLGLNYTGQDKSNSRSPVFMPTMTDNKPAADITASPDGWTNLQSWEAMSQQQPSNNNANEDIAIPSPSTFMRNIRIGGFVMTEPQEEQEEVQHSKSIEELERIEKEEQEDALFMQNVVSMLDLDTVLDIPLSFPDEDWTMIDRIGEVEANEATTGTVFLNKRSEVPEARVQEEEQEEEMAFEDMYEDAFDPEDLQAMTVDPEDEHVFRDFLLRLESEDETPEAAPQPAAIPAFMDTLILDNDHAPPCGSSKRRRQRFSFFSNPAALLPAIQRLLFGGPANQIPTQEFEAMKVGERKESGTTSGPHHHVRGQVFEYLCGWSDLMILAITMCFGGLLLGLAQSRTLYQQLMDHHLEIYSEPAETSSGRDKSFWIPLISCLLISGSALTLTVVMTLTECWDVPSIYFVGIGIAGMILVHAWVPNVGLLAEVVLDFSTDDQFMEGDEMTEEQEHLIQRDIPSPYVQVFVDDSPSDDEDEDEISSPLMAERRNACSLDESRRWEVNQRPCLEPSCFSP